MTRILVYGTVDDIDFVHEKLDYVNRIYGPITCVIHMHHLQALDWQRKVSRQHPVRHLPISENWLLDGIAAPDRCRDKLFAARPDYVIIFEMPENRGGSKRPPKVDPTRKKSKVELITLRAVGLGLPVLTYTYSHKPNIGQTVAQPAACARV